jgi:hypothetical protein
MDDPRDVPENRVIELEVAQERFEAALAAVVGELQPPAVRSRPSNRR